MSAGLLCAFASCLPVLSSGAPVAAPAAQSDANAAALEAIRAKHDVPALGAAVFTGEAIEGAWVAGMRAADSEVAAEVDDAWHLGSCTKSMTATLIALLVERGDLKWETPLPKLLPDLATKLHRDFADITLVELLSHRAGIAAMTGPDATLNRCAALSGTPKEQRREFAREVLTRPPTSTPRQTGVYSNAGIMIAGHIAEHAAGKPWEELMQSLLFDPLQMTTAGFGSPGFPDELAALRGHQRQDRKLVAIEPGAGSDNPSFLGPAGTVHASLADWAKYLQLHLRGATADQKVGAITLRKETFARLHTAYPMAAGDSFGYGYGWLITKRDWAAGDGKVLTHNGSNGLWLATCWLDPVGGFGVIACCNAGDAGAAAANDAAVGLAANERLDARTKARAAKSSGGPSP